MLFKQQLNDVLTWDLGLRTLPDLHAQEMAFRLDTTWFQNICVLSSFLWSWMKEGCRLAAEGHHAPRNRWWLIAVSWLLGFMPCITTLIYKGGWSGVAVVYTYVEWCRCVILSYILLIMLMLGVWDASVHYNTICIRSTEWLIYDLI